MSNFSILQNDHYNLNAYYGFFSWFITGEHRVYNLSAGHFNRVHPKKNFGENGGTGAFQLSIRYSSVDLNDKDLRGGKLKDLTVGLNWYLNPATRLMFNYINSDAENMGNVNAYLMRFQVDF